VAHSPWFPESRQATDGFGDWTSNAIAPFLASHLTGHSRLSEIETASCEQQSALHRAAKVLWFISVQVVALEVDVEKKLLKRVCCERHSSQRHSQGQNRPREPSAVTQTQTISITDLRIAMPRIPALQLHFLGVWGFETPNCGAVA
jgi:hypothetical protein